jgi:hypothetical protein
MTTDSDWTESYSGSGEWLTDSEPPALWVNAPVPDYLVFSGIPTPAGTPRAIITTQTRCEGCGHSLTAGGFRAKLELPPAVGRFRHERCLPFPEDDPPPNRPGISFVPTITTLPADLTAWSIGDTDRPDYRHARDIPDRLFLAAVDAATLDGAGWATRWHVGMVLGGLPLQPFVDEVPGVPAKVVLAKARRLIRRGLLSGCDCGCRGDFELTAKGIAELGSNP